MKEYIEREAAIKEIKFVRSLMATESEWLHGYASGLGAAVDALVDAPAADVVEVVKCKDCRWYDDPFSDDFVCMLPVKFSDGLKYPRKEAMPPYGFCSKGERRVGNDWS